MFRYSVVVVTVLYLALSFSHPDYIIAAVNVANAPRSAEAERVMAETDGYNEDFFSGPFFLGEYYSDYSYLSMLSADAAPVLLSYMDELGYDTSVIEEDNLFSSEKLEKVDKSRRSITGFGYHYMNSIKMRLDKFSWRTFNISRYMMLQKLDALK